MRRVANRTLERAEAWEWAARAERYRAEAAAREVARSALKGWYRRGFANADSAIPKMQIESNLKRVAAIPGWQENKGANNGYVMLDMLMSGALRPVVVVLDYESKACGGLTYRQLHRQIRLALELEPKVSMRLRCHRPWCRYMLEMPIPERSALPATDVQCTHLLGTTLSCYLYVHLTGDG